MEVFDFPSISANEGVSGRDEGSISDDEGSSGRDEGSSSDDAYEPEYGGTFACAICQVQCNNLLNINKHLGGKRHKRQVANTLRSRTCTVCEITLQSAYH
jgi:hypothetical protein